MVAAQYALVYNNVHTFALYVSVCYTAHRGRVTGLKGSGQEPKS